jgi:hypothetical protein
MIGFIIGLILGLIPGGILYRAKYKEKKRLSLIPKHIRRGILTNECGISRAGTKLYDVEVQFEVGELESTDTMSKIEVISCTVSQSSSNSEKDRKEFSDMVNNSWVDSDRIKWITSTASKRNSKIDQILN